MFDQRRLQALQARTTTKLTRVEQRAFEAFSDGLAVERERQRLRTSTNPADRLRAADGASDYDLWLNRDCPGVG